MSSFGLDSNWRIPVMRPRLPQFDEVEPYLRRIDSTRIYSNNGPLVQELENRYASFLGVEPARVVCMANATLALVACVQTNELESYLVPDFTFAATGLAVKLAGRKVLIGDIDSETWVLKLESKIPNTCGLMPVAPFGAPIDSSFFSYTNHVVVDAAASIGALGNNFSKMKPRDAVVFSLHATKVLGCGEGALVVCGSSEFANDLRSYATFGFDSNRISLILGSNCKMSEFSAAYALASMDQYATEYSQWRTRLDLMDEISKKLGLDNVTNNYQGIRPYWIVQLTSVASKERTVYQLNSKGIQTRNWWPSLLSSTPSIEGRLISNNVVSKLVRSNTLGLPLWRDLPLEYIFEIEGSLSNAIELG